MIGDEGRAMRCKNCGHEWFQTLNGEEELKAHAAPDDDVSDDLQDDAGEDNGQTDAPDDIDFDEDLDLGAFDPDAIPEQPDDDDDLENFYTADDDDAADQSDQGEENADDSDLPIDDDSAELDAEDPASPQEDTPSGEAAADDDAADAQDKPKKGAREKSGGTLFGAEPEEVTAHVFMASYGGAAVIFVAVLILLMAVNRPVMHVFPGAASFYGLFGVQPPLEGEQLIISQLEAVTETNNDNVRVLNVRGEILNLGQEDSAVPAMQISSSKDGQEALAWVDVTKQDTIAPDETVRFQMQHANPPADLSDLTVTFIPIGGEKALGRTVGVEEHTQSVHSAD